MTISTHRWMGTTEVLNELLDTEVGTHLHTLDEEDGVYSVLFKTETYTWVNIGSGIEVGARQLALAIVRYNAEWVLT